MFINKFAKFIVPTIFIIIFSLLINECNRQQAISNNTYSYRGTITVKNYIPIKNKDTKYEEPAVYYVWMREDVTHCQMRVQTTIESWKSLNVGSRTGFTLSNSDLYWYKNLENSDQDFYTIHGKSHTKFKK